MAAMLIRSCLKRGVSRIKYCDGINDEVQVKLLIASSEIILSQCTCYHTSHVLWATRKRKDELQRRIKDLELAKINPKIKKKVPVVNVWKRMTVKDLATSAGRPMRDIKEALSLVDPEIDVEADSIFEDPAMLNETVRKLGAKARTINPPTLKTNEELNEMDQDAVKRPPPDPSQCVARRPVVTIMGHVDHGKTTLLDSLRHTSVVDSEFGGITQHIGAFNVTLGNGEKITFLDTPGHAAFSTMRARGAQATDIVILVVAADDGVMEQTVQSIKMARDAKVPIIVAVNKIDKPNLDFKKVHNGLAKHGVIVEDLGGDVQCVNISALKGLHLERLMETVLLQAELMELKGDPTGLVEGVVIESTNDLHRGKLATALIQRGTLRKGDVLVCGLAWAKVRAMFDHSGSIVSQATLSDAVQIIGWRELPVAGEEILQVENERQASAVLRVRQAKIGEIKSIEQKKVADEKHREHLVVYRKNVEKRRALGVRKLKHCLREEEVIQEDIRPKVDLIIKGDVLGSVEAIMDVLDTYNDDDRCRLSIVHYGVGPVTETDIELAKAFDGLIYCFNTNVPKSLAQRIAKENISVRHHKVIYKLIDDLKSEITKVLPTIKVEEEIGQAVVLQEFEINEKKKKVKVAGCRVTTGFLKKSALFKVERDGEVIYKGKAVELRHLKNVVESVKENVECGVKLENVNIDFKPNDVLICYRMVEKNQEVEWYPGF
ncbi:hypothetical protein QAD02_001508 [Eretmocerus hayati]|uniref:Uncharacterized protein n=1 Tax=Eretmocerus hayati TaxID=131215 RepID=A0ACC2NIU2_9HYME|nr:hypothetical protein QAD02_001508 [Eretmocerus hayati]